MTKTKVALIVPSGDGTVLADFLPWLNQMQRWVKDDTAEFPFEFEMVGVIKGCSPVEYARNRMVEDFLKTDAEILWMVDADMVPQAYSHRVLFGRFDVSAGPCPMFSKVGAYKACRPNLFAGDVENEVTRIWTDEDECVAAGTANMAIRRKVLEDPAMKTAQDGWFQKRYGEKGSVRMGEDVDFCLRAQQNGHTFGVVGEAQMGHVKPLDMDEVFKCVSNQVLLLNDALLRLAEEEA